MDRKTFKNLILGLDDDVRDQIVEVWGIMVKNCLRTMPSEKRADKKAALYNEIMSAILVSPVCHLEKRIKSILESHL